VNAERQPSDQEAAREAVHHGDLDRAARLLSVTELEPAEASAVFGALPSATAAQLLREFEEPRAREVLLWLPPEQSATVDPAAAAAAWGSQAYRATSGPTSWPWSSRSHGPQSRLSSRRPLAPSRHAC